MQASGTKEDKINSKLTKLHNNNVMADMAIHANKDINLKRALNSELAPLAKELEKELHSLKEHGVLEQLDPSDPRYAIALQEACPTRSLLDVKRDGIVKTRLIKRGDLEDVSKSDTFHYLRNKFLVRKPDSANSK